MVVEGSSVYILDPSGSLDVLDSTAATKPTLSNTWFILLIRSLVQKVLPRPSTSEANNEDEKAELDSDDGDVSSTTASESPASGTSTPRDDLGARLRTEKAGGKRRKVIRKH